MEGRDLNDPTDRCILSSAFGHRSLIWILLGDRDFDIYVRKQLFFWH